MSRQPLPNSPLVGNRGAREEESGRSLSDLSGHEEKQRSRSLRLVFEREYTVFSRKMGIAKVFKELTPNQFNDI